MLNILLDSVQQNAYYFQRQPPNGRRYRQARDLADKATRRRIRRWGRIPESVGECPHLSGARGVGRAFAMTILNSFCLISSFDLHMVS